MSTPPDNLISKVYDSTGKLTNIPGQYRKCEEVNCPTYVGCPYSRCNKHWTALANGVKVPEWTG